MFSYPEMQHLAWSEYNYVLINISCSRYNIPASQTRGLFAFMFSEGECGCAWEITAGSATDFHSVAIAT